MLGFQGLTVKPLLGYTFPGDDTTPRSANLIVTQHLLQEIFGLLLPLGDSLQFLTGFIILSQQISSGIRQGDMGLGDAVTESVSKELSGRIGAIQRRGRTVLHMVPETSFQFNEHRNQFLVTLHEPPFECVSADQDGDVGSGVPSDGHAVLHLEHILVRDGIFPLAGLVCGGSLSLEDARPNVRDFTGSVQIRQHEGMFLALEQLALVADLDPSALGKLSPDKRLQLRPPVGSFPGFLGRELPCLIQPQLCQRQ